MNEIIFHVQQAEEGGYVARALGESIFTEADTLAALRLAIQDAVRCHFDEGNMPRIIRLQRVNHRSASSKAIPRRAASSSTARPC